MLVSEGEQKQFGENIFTRGVLEMSLWNEVPKAGRPWDVSIRAGMG